MKLRANVGCILNSYFKIRKPFLFSLFFIVAVIGIQLATIEVPAAAVPNPPSNLTVTAISTSSLSLRWQDNSSDEAGFQIERCQGATCTNFALRTQVAANTITFTDTGLLANTTYRYRIAAFGRNSKLSPYSNIAGAATFSSATAPAAPSNLVATVISTSQINLTWTDNSNNESGFIVERALVSTGPWTQVGTTSANITSWANAGLSAATTYYYRVKAYNSVGSSSYTNIASATTQSTLAPAAPSNLLATAPSSSQINLSWSDNSSNETGFKIERCQGSGCSSFVQITTVAGNSTSYQNTGLSSSTSYSYRVRAYNGNGDSGYSNTASATTAATVAADTTAPTVPTGLTATAVSSSQINLSWNPSTDSGGSGLAGYRVYQSGTLVGSTAATTTTYSRTGLAASTQYCYTVAAYDNAGNVSGQSAQACATTQAASLSATPWSKSFGSTVGDAGQAVAFDSGGNLIMTGYFQGTVDFGKGSLTSNGSTYPDIVLAKYSSTGTCLWSKRFGGTLDDKGYGVAVDANDNVVVAGYFAGTADFGGGSVTGQRGYNIFVAKYAADGTYQWARTYGNVSGGDNKAYAVAVDTSGNIAITGTFQNTVDFGGGSIIATGSFKNIFVAKLSASGAQVWSKGFGSLDGADNFGQGIGFDPSGNVAVTGYFQGTIDFGGGPLISSGAGDDIFVAKYGPNGAHLWSKRFGDAANQEALAAAVDSSGNIVITGMFKGTIDFGGGPMTDSETLYPDGFVAKLSTSGGHVWSKQLSSPNPVVGRGIAVDSNSNVVVTGYFFGTVDFGGGPLTSNGQNTFLAKYSAAGAHQWSRGYAGTNFGMDVATDSNGNVGVTGWFQGTVDFGNGTLISAGSLDTFLLKRAP